MWVSCLLLVVLGSAAAKTIFPVPEPYRWDETFTVEFPQMDDEHMSKQSRFLGRFDKWEALVPEHELTWAKWPTGWSSTS